jgi:heat shock protein HslJ
MLDALRMGPIATTRMACQPEVMEREQEVLTRPGRVRYTEGTHLKLTKDNVLAELIRRDPD